MNTRPIAATFFVVFCLLLCGLILRRQIIAHPLPPDSGHQRSSGQGSSGQDSWVEQNWQPAAPVLAKQVQGVVRAEITALRGGDMPKALSYRSQAGQQRFLDPEQFMQLMQERHPELRAERAAQYGPVGIDQSGQNAWTVVLLRNWSGERTRDNFLLVREVREGGAFKISRILSQPLPN